MTILLTGGGTGGHIMPLLAVAHELKKAQPSTKLVYVGEKSGKFQNLTANNTDIDEVRRIFAGKFRRYHGESWLRRLADIRTNLLNIRDVIFLLIGFFQALWLIIRRRPEVVFIKGGYVGVPVGLAAALCRVPYITHDSDTTAGLANRLIGRSAKLHGTGMPAEFYSYAKEKIRFTGVPISQNFKPVSADNQKAAKTSIGVPEDSQLVLITGGSQGSRRINGVIKQILPDLLERNKSIFIIHHVGQGNENLYQGYHHSRLRTEPFINNFHEVSAASDVIIARASATTIAEISAQGRALIVIPSPFLAGGHQLKNAEYLAKHGAAIIVSETEVLSSPDKLLNVLENLLENQDKRQQLSENISKLAKPAAAKELAAIILETAQR